MGILKDSTKKKEIQSLSVALWNELQNVDEEYAKSYLAWCIEKLKTNKNHFEESIIKSKLKKLPLNSEEQTSLKVQLKKVKHKNHPLNISKGDIVHVRFGINIGDELSDLDTKLTLFDGHYGIVLAQKGFMFLILPLTSHPQRLGDSSLEFYYENLELPGGCNKSYPAFAKMQFVHLRRIKRIHGIPDGKKQLSPEQISELDTKIKKLLNI